jgi:hypothetical protein
VLSDAGSVSSFGDDAHNVIVIEWSTGTSGDKQTYLAGFAREHGTCFFQIKFQGSDRTLSEWHHAFCIAFAMFDPKRGALQVSVIDGQRD